MKHNGENAKYRAGRKFCHKAGNTRSSNSLYNQDYEGDGNASSSKENSNSEIDVRTGNDTKSTNLPMMKMSLKNDTTRLTDHHQHQYSKSNNASSSKIPNCF